MPNEELLAKLKAFALMLKYGHDLFDAATVATPGPDCLHMDRDSHKALAEALAAEVRKILG